MYGRKRESVVESKGGRGRGSEGESEEERGREREGESVRHSSLENTVNIQDYTMARGLIFQSTHTLCEGTLPSTKTEPVIPDRGDGVFQCLKQGSND